MPADDSKSNSNDTNQNPGLITKASAAIFTTIVAPVLVALGLNFSDSLVDNAPPRPQAGKDGSSSAESAKTDAAKSDAVKTDVPKVEVAKLEPPKVDPPTRTSPHATSQDFAATIGSTPRPANTRKKKAATGDQATAQNEGRFRSLINRKNLAGWTAVEEKHWSIDPKNGALIGENAEKDAKNFHGWIHTNADFTDFRLRIEFFIDAETDSGIALRTRADPNYDDRFIVQLNSVESSAFGTGMLIGLRAGPGHPNTKPLVSTTLRSGDVNVMEITFVGTHLQATVNGKLVQDTQIDPQSIDANSSKKMVSPTGRIGLKCRVGRIEFRKIEIQELNQNTSK